MFPGAIVHGGLASGTAAVNLKFGWNITTTLSSIQDGLTNTILLAESTTAGYSGPGEGALQDLASNWACPYPTFTSFLASDNVCDPSTPITGSAGTCFSANLGVTSGTGGQVDGVNWDFANKPGTNENIGVGLEHRHFHFAAEGKCLGQVRVAIEAGFGERHQAGSP